MDQPREPGVLEHRLKHREIGEPRDAVAVWWRHVREGQQQLPARPQRRGEVREARRRLCHVLEHVEAVGRVELALELPDEIGPRDIGADEPDVRDVGEGPAELLNRARRHVEERHVPDLRS